jgi:Complex I intermediate-associated protein 30 (CIA30)
MQICHIESLLCRSNEEHVETATRPCSGSTHKPVVRHVDTTQHVMSSLSDGVPMPPIPIFDFTRDVDVADAHPITSTSVNGWTVSDDGVINGSSTSQAVLLRTTQCWKTHLQSTNHRIKPTTTVPTKQQPDLKQPNHQHSFHEGENHLRHDSNEINNEEDSTTTTQLLSRPYIRWYGNLNTTIGFESKVQRSGFCAIRSPIFPFDGASLQGLYTCLEIQCRYIPVVMPTITTTSNPSNEVVIPDNKISDSSTESEQQQQQQQRTNDKLSQHGPSRIFTLNLRVTSALNDDIYQGFLSLDHPMVSPTEPKTTDRDENMNDNSHFDSSINEESLPPFRTFIIPFDELLLTARGREREFQRRLEGSVDIESIGFLLMDNIQGPFQFDIAKIRAINCLEDGTVYESPTQVSRDPSVQSTSSVSLLEDQPTNDDLSSNVEKETTGTIVK